MCDVCKQNANSDNSSDDGYGARMMAEDAPFDFGQVEYQHMNADALREIACHAGLVTKKKARDTKKQPLVNMLVRRDQKRTRVCDFFGDPEEVPDQGQLKEVESNGRRVTTTQSSGKSLHLTDQTMKPCLLLDLPPELRNSIYRYVTVSHQALLRPQQPALIRTSQQIRQEARPIFYGENSFVLQVPNGLADRSYCPIKRGFRRRENDEIIHAHESAWLRSIGPDNVALMRLFTFLRNPDPSWNRVEGWPRLEVYHIEVLSMEGKKIHLHSQFAGRYEKCRKPQVTRGLYHAKVLSKPKKLTEARDESESSTDCYRERLHLRLEDVNRMLKNVSWMVRECDEDGKCWRV